MFRSALVVASLLVAVAGVVLAGPIGSCTIDNGGVGPGFTCDIFETDINGNPSEISSVISLPGSVTAGYIVLLQSPGAVQSDVPQWSDVLVFDNGSGLADTVQLLSSGCNCFPDFATVSSSPNAFIIENQNGVGDDLMDVTVFSSAPNTYNIHSASPVGGGAASTPEPTTLGLLGSGLLGVLAAVRRPAASLAND